MIMQKTELTQKISKLKSVVPKKTTNPVLQGILVQNGYLIANNMEMTVKTKAEGTEGEHFIIPLKAFDLISNLPDGDVEIIPKGKTEILIKAEKIKNKYQTMDPELFPTGNFEESNNQEFKIKSSDLLTSIKRVIYAIPNQNAKPTMTAMCLQAKDGTLNFVGLDGHVLAWDKLDYEGDFELLIPKNAVEKLQTIGLTGEVSIRHNKVGAAFVTEEYEVYTRLIEGEYFKYTNLFSELPLHTVVARDVLLNTMTRVKMCVEGRPAKFEMVGAELSVSISDQTSDYQESVSLQEELSEPLTIGFNAQLVIETLKAFDCDNVGIQLSSAKMPMIVEAEDSDFRAIVLPVAIK